MGYDDYSLDGREGDFLVRPIRRIHSGPGGGSSLTVEAGLSRDFQQANAASSRSYSLVGLPLAGRLLLL